MHGSDGAHTQLGSRAVRQPPCAQWTISPSIHLPAFQALWPYRVPCPLLGQVRFSQGLVQGGEKGCAGGVWRVDPAPCRVSLTLQGTPAPAPAPGGCEGMFRHLSLIDQSHLSTAAQSFGLLDPKLCYLLDGILFIYGVIVTALFLRAKVGTTGFWGEGMGSPARWMFRGPWCWVVPESWCTWAKQGPAKCAHCGGVGKGGMSG